MPADRLPCGFMCNAVNCPARCMKDYRSHHKHLCEVHDRMQPPPRMVLGG